MKILFLGAFAEPQSSNGNSLLASQAIELQNLGYSVDVLTRPRRFAWRGSLPDGSQGKLANVPHLITNREGLQYHVVMPPALWGDRAASQSEWQCGVTWATQALKELAPDLVHLHSWQDMLYFLWASTHLGIPTFYSAYDYGVPCLQSHLMRNGVELCDGSVELQKCIRCSFSVLDRSGKFLDWFSNLPFGPRMLSFFYGKNASGILRRKFGQGARYPYRTRIQWMLARWQAITPVLDGVIATSPFARHFFTQLGLTENRIHVLPWFYNQPRLCAHLPENQSPLVLGFVARLVEHKGLHILLQALSLVKADLPVVLKIAGAVDSPYSHQLQAQYPSRSGAHQVEWLGWVQNSELDRFFEAVHVAVVPSLWYDNTPTTMVEALAQGRSVVCSDVPSMTHLAQPGVNALTFPLGDVASLARHIETLASHPELVSRLSERTRNVLSAREYAQKLSEIYQTSVQSKRV